MKTLLGTIAIAAMLGWFGPSLDDHSAEQAIADDLQAAQHLASEEDRKYRHAANLCIAEAGPGAVPVFDADWNFQRCAPRRGKS